jgi:shikimate dehydrogenase
MPHKVTTVGLLDDCSTTVKVAGSCNAILRRDDGTLMAISSTAPGSCAASSAKGFPLRGARCLVVGTGGVGSAIAAALAAAGVGTIALYDNNAEGRDGLASACASTIRRSKCAPTRAIRQGSTWS